MNHAMLLNLTCDDVEYEVLKTAIEVFLNSFLGPNKKFKIIDGVNGRHPAKTVVTYVRPVHTLREIKGTV